MEEDAEQTVSDLIHGNIAAQASEARARPTTGSLT